MTFQQGQKTQTKPKKESDNCVVDVKKTKTGKRITIRGKCNREKLEHLKEIQSDLD